MNVDVAVPWRELNVAKGLLNLGHSCRIAEELRFECNRSVALNLASGGRDEVNAHRDGEVIVGVGLVEVIVSGSRDYSTVETVYGEGYEVRSIVEVRSGLPSIVQPFMRELLESGREPELETREEVMKSMAARIFELGVSRAY